MGAELSSRMEALVSAPSASAVGGDKAMTADREEKKFLIPHGALEHLRGELDHHLSRHRYTGNDANRLPEAQHFVTTIYFDTAAHTQLTRAEQDPRHNVKVRAKEYYDMHPTLAEVAVSPEEIVHCKPWLWFEIKQRNGDRTEKWRCRVAKREMLGFFDGTQAAQVGDPDSERARIASQCQQLGEGMEASCLVNYQRVAWQDPSAKLRVTLDFDVAFYAPPRDLWTRNYALLRSTLGPAMAVEPWLILEVKTRGDAPEWLEQALAACGAQESGFSKFVRAGRALYRRTG